MSTFRKHIKDLGCQQHLTGEVAVTSGVNGPGILEDPTRPGADAVSEKLINSGRLVYGVDDGRKRAGFQDFFGAFCNIFARVVYILRNGARLGRAAWKGRRGQWGGENGAAERQRERSPVSAGFSLELVVDNPTKMPPGDLLGGIVFTA
jgi:hypothetical protein